MLIFFRKKNVKFFCIISKCCNFRPLVAISTEDQNEAPVPGGFHFFKSIV